MKKLLSLFVALIATCALWASNVITYKATSKLSEVTSRSDYGLHTNAFNVSITSHTFSNGTGTITFAGEVTSIGDYAFCYCSGLTSITIPNSVTSIGDVAFACCTSLTSITIPNSVMSIGDGAFYGCSNLPIVGGIRYADTYLIEAVDKTKNIYSIKSGTKWIGFQAFYECTDLTSITIPNSVTSIGDYAFYSCTGLTSITIGNSVTSIGDNAFYNCNNLKTVWNCSSLNITRGYSDHGYVAYNADKVYKGIPVDDFVILNDTILTYYLGQGGNVVIPNSVTSIGERAFYNCTGLTSITIPNSVTSIGSYAFYNCSGLTSITIPNSVTSIGERAFYNCTGLTSITLPNSVTSIGVYAFDGCSGLTSIVVESGNPVYDSRNNCNAIIETSSNTLVVGCQNTIIPNSVTSIESKAFYGCSSLTSITIPNSVTNIGSYAFYGCSGLTSITIPNSVTSIGKDAFTNCTNITSVTWNARNCVYDYKNRSPFVSAASKVASFTFGSEVEVIPENLCRDLTSLTAIAIPNSVTSIGDGTFAGCTNLDDIYSYAVTPPSAYEESFLMVSQHTPIHVPAGTIRAYQKAVGWSHFLHYFEMSGLPEGTPTDSVGVTVEGNYATFTWPVNPTASSYTLTITKDGEVFCTLTFNSLGQLVGMGFAPARSGASAAENTAYGYSFVITGLESNSNYSYSFTANDGANNIIESHNGSFVTESSTAINTIDAAQQSTKLLRDGQILIQRGAHTFTLQGQVVE